MGFLFFKRKKQIKKQGKVSHSMCQKNKTPWTSVPEQQRRPWVSYLSWKDKCGNTSPTVPLQCCERFPRRKNCWKPCLCHWSLLLPLISQKIHTSTKPSVQQAEVVLRGAGIWEKSFLKYPKIEGGERKEEQFNLPLQCQLVCHDCEEKEHLAAWGIWALQLLVEYFYQLNQNIVFLPGIDHCS